MSGGVLIASALGLWMLIIGLVLSLLRASRRSEADLEPSSLGAQATRTDAPLLHSPGDEKLGRLLRTLAHEDPSAGRHAAAVARDSLALAREAGLGERDQEVAHAAGLLHDIGKETSLNAIPVAKRELRRSDHRLIRRHPVEGARLVREVPGFELVADAVLSHHERLDGNGYPFGLRGKSIPPAARVVAVAEVYDVLTAPDSYRPALTTAEAVAELRDAAGTQLDPELVEIFATTVANRAGGADSGDADLETELRRRRFAGELLDA